MKARLNERFQMSDLGGVSYLLGWHIVRDRQRRLIFINQEKYSTKVLERFGMGSCRPVKSPEDHMHKLHEEDCPTTPEGIKEMENVPYREAVGSFMYLMMGTRPDLANFVRQASRYLKNPGKSHWNYVLRGLKYLSGTKSYGIKLGAADITPEQMSEMLSAFSDADYGNCMDTKRSVSGYVTYLFGDSPISWRSQLQKVVTLSTAEAEYVALAAAVQEVLYMRQLLSELGFEQSKGIQIGEDNQATIKISKNPEHHGRCKHIDIRYFFVQERVQSGDIDIFYCPTDKMPADILTKGLTPEKFCRLRDLLGVRAKAEVLDCT